MRHLRTLWLFSSLLMLTVFNTVPPVSASSGGTPWGGDGSLSFIENVGQFPPQARFQVRGAGTVLWLAEDALWLTLADPPDGVHLRLTFPNANPHPHLEPFDRLDSVVNYYIGSDPTGWHTDVPVWGGVRYRNLYPGVDLEIAGQDGHPVWRWTCRDDCSALQDLRLRVEGSRNVTLRDNFLLLTTSLGDVSLPLPVVAGSPRPAAPALIRVDGMAFEVTSPYAAAPSVPSAGQTDYPEEAYFGSFLGGGGDDWAYDLAVAGQGDVLNRDDDFPDGESRSVWLVGTTYSDNFPTEPGNVTLHGTTDAFVTRFKRTAVYVCPTFSTYIGGQADDAARSIALDAEGNAYVVGWTTSDNFAVTANAYDVTYNGCADAFVLKLRLDGTLLYSSYLGGSHCTVPGHGDECGDDDAYAVVERDGLIYLTGGTTSQDFPTTPGAYDRTYANPNSGLSEDVFVVKLNPAGNGSADLLYSTFVGGGAWERGYDLAVNTSGLIYVTGQTGELFAVGDNDFPTTPAAFDTQADAGDPNAFFLLLDPAGNGGADLLYSTFLGGEKSDTGHGIATDAVGNAYIVGETGSPDFPTTSGALDTTCGSDGNCDWRNDFFLSRIAPNGSGHGDLLYSTFIGGNYWEGFQGKPAVAVGPDGDVYVSGDSSSDAGFPITADAYDPNGDPSAGDIGLVRLRPDGNGADDLVYGTFVGGFSTEAGQALTLDEDGRVYVAGYTRSGSFPTTAHALYDHIAGSYDAFFFRILTPPSPDLSTSSKTVAPRTATAGETVTFTVRLVNTGPVGAAALLTDILPSELLLVGSPIADVGTPAVDGQTLTWAGDVAANGTVVITYAAVVTSGLTLMPIVANEAYIADGCGHTYLRRAFVNGYGLYLPLVLHRAAHEGKINGHQLAISTAP